jgi:hypothetical protein
MKLVWMANTQYAHTLYKQLPDQKKPHHMAWVAHLFGSNQPPNMWRARVIATKDEAIFPSLEQAKDWAQAVVLLNQ